MTTHSMTFTTEERDAIAAIHAAMMAANAVPDLHWASQADGIYGLLYAALVDAVRYTYGAGVDVQAFAFDLHDGATVLDAEMRLVDRHHIGTVHSADRQHWIETGEHVRHDVSISVDGDATYIGGPGETTDEAFAWFCECGQRGEWIHTDTEPDSLDGALHGGALHLEEMGLPYDASVIPVRYDG